jgi:mRNA interferase RelE/StbE
LGYKVKYAERAWRAIEKMDRPIKRKIIAFVDKIEASQNPRFSGKALQGNDREWRYRVGDYRLICEIKDSEMIVWMVKIGHRKEVYK